MPAVWRDAGLGFARNPKDAISFETVGTTPALDDLSLSIAAIARDEYKNKSTERLKGSGYVVESPEAALWCFWNTSTCRDAVI